MKINLKAGPTDTVPIDSVRRVTFALATGFAESSTSAYAPAAFRILQNFPNPFNPSTTIVYETAGASEVRVRVFDTRGALIRDLVHEAQSAGMHQVVWDGTGNGQVHVASGVYISVVHSGGQVLSRKMILMK
jgi:hypothetical protein